MDFKLNEEQLEFQETCRRFAREVIRPLADKYDREEGVPWEAIKAAREWGLHGLDHIQRMGQDPDGVYQLHLRRGAPLGLRRNRARDPGRLARRGRHRQLRHAGADRALGARVLRDGRRDQARRLRGDRGGRRLRRPLAAHHGQAGRRRVGPERHQGLHHERRDRRRDGRRRDRGSRARASRPGFVRGPEGHSRAVDGQEGVQARHPRLADGRGRARGRPDPDGLPARRVREAPEEARARALGPVLGSRLGRARDVRAHAPAGGRVGAGHRPGGLRVDARVPRGQVRGRRAAARAAAHPADARRRGHRDRGRPPARVARRLDGTQRRAR